MQHDTALEVTAIRVVMEQVKTSQLLLMQEEHSASVEQLKNDHEQQLDQWRATLSNNEHQKGTYFLFALPLSYFNCGAVLLIDSTCNKGNLLLYLCSDDHPDLVLAPHKKIVTKVFGLGNCGWGKQRQPPCFDWW